MGNATWSWRMCGKVKNGQKTIVSKLLSEYAANLPTFRSQQEYNDMKALMQGSNFTTTFGHTWIGGKYNNKKDHIVLSKYTVLSKPWY